MKFETNYYSRNMIYEVLGTTNLHGRLENRKKTVRVQFNFDNKGKQMYSKKKSHRLNIDYKSVFLAKGALF